MTCHTAIWSRVTSALLCGEAPASAQSDPSADPSGRVATLAAGQGGEAGLALNPAFGDPWEGRFPAGDSRSCMAGCLGLGLWAWPPAGLLSCMTSFTSSPLAASVVRGRLSLAAMSRRTAVLRSSYLSRKSIPSFGIDQAVCMCLAGAVLRPVHKRLLYSQPTFRPALVQQGWSRSSCV